MEKYKNIIQHNKFKISAPAWNEEFELPDGSYTISDIQDYFEYILKKHEAVADNPSIKLHVNIIENRITFKIKTGHYVELLTPETMKLLRSTKSKITKHENGESVSNLEITEVVLTYCNIVNIDYQEDSRVLYIFLPNKSFGESLDISTKNFIFLKTFDLEFVYTEVWLTDQNYKLLEI